MRTTAKRPLLLTFAAALLLSGLAIRPAAAAANEVQICKTTSAANPATGSFTFTVKAVSPSTIAGLPATVTVPVGGCSTPLIPVPGGSKISVTEAAQANTTLAAITVAGGVLDSSNLTTRVAFVRPGASVTTVVTFRNQAVPTPPACPAPGTVTPVLAVSSAPVVFDLKSGSPMPTNIPGDITFHGSAGPQALSGADQGWDRMALKINMTYWCKANIVVEYEGDPTMWTVDIGDSPSNDGWAGDAGDTMNAAEVQILNGNLALYSKALAPGNAPLLDTFPLSLKDGAYKFVVSNGALTTGQPYYSRLGNDLFAIPDPISTDGSNIYAAFNSVVSQRPDRVGHGVRRVMITLQK